jgi:hypothetical protein
MIDLVEVVRLLQDALRTVGDLREKKKRVLAFG